MIRTDEQRQAYEADYKTNLGKYQAGQNTSKCIEAIRGNTARCLTLVSLVGEKLPSVVDFLAGLKRNAPELYFHEIPHWTFDCHRYEKDASRLTQLATPEETAQYQRILQQEIGKEKPFEIEVGGIVCGGDGIMAAVWYDTGRMVALTNRIRKRVKEETPVMDNPWGLAVNQFPKRFVNLARFTGAENREKVADIVMRNKDLDFGGYELGEIDLLDADHYIQKERTRVLERFALRG